MGAVTHGARGVHAVIVTYRPDTAKLAEIIAALDGTVDSVVLVDNGSAGWDPQALRSACPALIVQQLQTNEGIAAAQNEGIALARARNASYVLLLDQDSVPQEGMVATLKEVLERLKRQGHRVACVGPRTRFPGSAELSTFVSAGWLGPRRIICRDAGSAVECDTLIASGSLIPMDVLEEVGGMEEDLFIDLVDIDWCLRARAKGYRVFGACGAVLEHRLGEATRQVWAGRWRGVPRHKPFRYYYIFRNTLLLSRREYMPLKWVLYHLRWLVILFVVHGVFSRTRGGELGMMLKGAVHGVRGVTGRLNDL